MVTTTAAESAVHPLIWGGGVTSKSLYFEAEERPRLTSPISGLTGQRPKSHSRRTILFPRISLTIEPLRPWKNAAENKRRSVGRSPSGRGRAPGALS